MNFNQYVTIQVTPEGRKLVKEYFSATAHETSFDEPWSTVTLQLWEVMKIFGNRIRFGDSKPPMSMEFKFVENSDVNATEGEPA